MEDINSYDIRTPLIGEAEFQDDFATNRTPATETPEPPSFSGNLSSDLAAIASSEEYEDLIETFTNYLFDEYSSYPDISENELEVFRGLINSTENKKLLKDKVLNFIEKSNNSHGQSIPEETLQTGEQVIQNFFRNLTGAYNRQITNFTQVRSILEKNILDGHLCESLELLEIRIIDSDPHNGGKHVCFLNYQKNIRVLDTRLCCFPGGIYSEPTTVVYKPRDLTVEASIINDSEEHLSAFSLINDIVEEAVLPTYRIVTGSDDNGAFGFMEFVQQTFRSAQEDEDKKKVDKEMVRKGLSETEVDQFYKRVGMLQYAAQLFGITDLNASNIFVIGDKQNGYSLCPIDLETSYDIRVLKGDYSTGLFDGLGLRKLADNNFIVVKKGNSPRGHGITDQDYKSIHEGFKYLQNELSKRETAKNRILEFTSNTYNYVHRYVPAATSDLSPMINRIEKSDEVYADEFFKILKEKFELSDIQKFNGTSYLQKNASDIKKAFLDDRIKGDIPFFLIDNSNGEITYKSILIGKIEGTKASHQERINVLDEMEIGELFKQKIDTTEQ